ncbi:Protein CBR-ATF-2 [Caenorhabditis briggsae]|uniref:BZIP domain-containing protein n=2 Tax=Caenorhabditis briggsae TaxID=6238 RepID=A0AAE9DLE0_CAEBR|nr:Protein CBR-ATF-2 [Caenorhabditis briggsae]ULU05696.1 hypothetical protein L3Y34_017971 [Caenorhabditis briggsae]UMM17649.1 hypothetical protein L5515_014092 [Caenorhabditis briggsae]CAP23497.1 Protein CBR-ATF-2 [Caenorhabditis briggsae]
MDVDQVSLSPSSRLSVVCSASAEFSSSSSDSSNFSEGSPPESRRNSVNESVIKDEHYWERRRRNNDASRRSREKRRLNDQAMEEKIMQLSAENERLKSQLENRPAVAPAPPPQPAPVVEPPTALIIPSVAKNLFPSGPVASLQASSMLSVPLLQTAPHFPSMLQLCQLQPTTIQSSVYTSTQPATSASSLFSSSSSSAFHPFRPSEAIQQSFPTSSVIMKVERRSPDSSTDLKLPQPQLQPGSNVIQQIGQPASSTAPAQPVVQQAPQQGPSLLSALLSQRRTSPSVPQSRTEHISGLNSPPRHTGNKSDCESVSSSASFSPSHSSEDHSNYSNKSPQYVDRRRRNNEAAKRCRANRRAVFEYRSRRVQLLEGENEELRSQIESLKAEIAHFKSVLAQRASVVTALRQ